jgi:hypothetical protein
VGIARIEKPGKGEFAIFTGFNNVKVLEGREVRTEVHTNPLIRSIEGLKEEMGFGISCPGLEDLKHNVFNADVIVTLGYSSMTGAAKYIGAFATRISYEDHKHYTEANERASAHLAHAIAVTADLPEDIDASPENLLECFKGGDKIKKLIVTDVTEFLEASKTNKAAMDAGLAFHTKMDGGIKNQAAIIGESFFNASQIFYPEHEIISRLRSIGDDTSSFLSDLGASISAVASKIEETFKDSY